MKNIFNLLIIFLFSNYIAFGQNISKKIDTIIASYHNTHPEVSISLGFISNEQEYYTAYGTIDKESSNDVDKNSIFEIASITKILTSNLLAQAVLENKIKLDDYIDDYLPKTYTLHKNLKHKIKVSDLASHQSGLPDIDFRKLIALNPQQPISDINATVIASMINNCNALIDYGHYRYSTMGYIILGQILESIYQSNYDTIINQKIIKSLEMTRTLTSDFQVTNRTTGYNPNGGKQAFFKWNIAAPAGLVKSSTTDMVAFLKAILFENNQITKASVITEKICYTHKNRTLGLGINIVTDDKNTIYLKSGDSMGQSSIICYNRVKKWGLIIFLNQRNHKLRQQLFNDIYETVLK